MRISNTMLGTYMACPLQAKFKYFENLPTKQGSRAMFGKAVHAALDHANRTLDWDGARKIFLDGWDDPATLGEGEIEVWNKGSSYGSLRQRGLDILRNMEERARWEDRTFIASEHKFVVPFGEHVLSGIVDCLSIRKNHRGKQMLTIEDYKALDVESRVLTPDGWGRFGDLTEGDRVIGVNGEATKVTGVYPQGRRTAYKVTFSDGTSVRCSDDHLWTVSHYATGTTSTVTLRDIMTAGLRQGRNRKWLVPTVEPVVYDPGPDLPIDPYVLGVLIGDGSLKGRGVRFTKPDPAVQDEVRKALPSTVELRVGGDGDRTIVGVEKNHNPISVALGHLGLRVGSKERFIPEPYLRASVADRIALLAGLMDTDGSSSNRIQYRTSSPRLAQDIMDLCRSLGGVPRGKPHRAWYRNNDEVVECGEAWHISPAVPFNPFRAVTKAGGWHPPRKRLVRYIDSVEEDGTAEMVCIKVAAPDGLFVTNDYVVTHNTGTRKPSITELALNTQFTIYMYATEQPEFWFGNPEQKTSAVPNAEWWWEMVKDMPRRGLWTHLWDDGKELDAGTRTEEDYARLYRAVTMIEKAVKYDVFVPHIGDACGLCDFAHGPCPVTPPTREEWAARLETDDTSWAS